MQILNAFSLPRAIVLRRLKTLDADVQVVLKTVYDEISNQTVAVIDVDINADVTSVNSLIQSAITAEETSFLSDLQLSKSQIKNGYLNMISRLDQIQAGSPAFTQTGFNQVVQAVKDEALYIEQIAKALKDIFT